MKKLAQLLFVLMIFTISILAVTAEPASTPSINEGSCILIDAKTGIVLYERNSDEQGLFPASTTKIMTALLAIEKGNLDTMMTASTAAINDIGKDGSNIGIMAGEQMSLRNLLKALMISSANETANIIAENICPTRQEFVDLMNAKAKELGALNTHFANPCGAHNPYHYTTAADLSKIARYAMTLPTFKDIVKEVSYELPPTNKHDSWPVLVTTNKLMQYDKGEAYKIIGVKTGYTGPAGYNLVSAANDSTGMEIISVVMNIKNDGAQANIKKYSKELLDYGFNNFSEVMLQADGIAYKSVTVEDALDEIPLELVTKGEVKYLMPKDKSLWNVKEKVDIHENISAPVNKGDLLGSIEYTVNGATVGKVDLLASRDVEIKPQAQIMNKIEIIMENKLVKNALISASFIIPGFLLLRLTLRTISRRIRTRKL